jgi:hypothetical protein
MSAKHQVIEKEQLTLTPYEGEERKKKDVKMKDEPTISMIIRGRMTKCHVEKRGFQPGNARFERLVASLPGGPNRAAASASGLIADLETQMIVPLFVSRNFCTAKHAPSPAVGCASGWHLAGVGAMAKMAMAHLRDGVVFGQFSGDFVLPRSTGPSAVRGSYRWRLASAGAMAKMAMAHRGAMIDGALPGR